REPSAEDINVTRQLVDAGKVMGIPLHDHIIFADNHYTSFAERGLL
ncbi:MAG: JAB domain-containing protein, partial [bacterium]